MAEYETFGADKGYDTADFVEEPSCANVSPHVARLAGRATGSSPLHVHW